MHLLAKNKMGTSWLLLAYLSWMMQVRLLDNSRKGSSNDLTLTEIDFIRLDVMWISLWVTLFKINLSSIRSHISRPIRKCATSYAMTATRQENVWLYTRVYRDGDPSSISLASVYIMQRRTSGRPPPSPHSSIRSKIWFEHAWFLLLRVRKIVRMEQNISSVLFPWHISRCCSSWCVRGGAEEIETNSWSGISQYIQTSVV